MITNIFIENIFETEIDLEKYKTIAKQIFEYYLTIDEIYKNSCLYNLDFNSISFDFLFCNGEKTHSINKEYRNKDYPADIITFAVFADSSKEEQFILDGEINLGEIILAIDKIKLEANNKGILYETELVFLISHGILHLLGFDHQTEDEYNFIIKHQKNALRNIGIEYDKV